MRRPCGQWVGRGAGARCDVDRWFPAARVLASGEDRLVPTSSRLILRLSRLTFALSGREVGGLRQPARAVGGQGAGARCDVDRWFPAARVLASGEDQLVPTSSRLILRLSRLKFALLAVSSVGCGCRRGQWAVIICLSSVLVKPQPLGGFFIFSVALLIPLYTASPVSYATTVGAATSAATVLAVATTGAPAR